MRAGRKMLLAAEYVMRSPGCTKKDVALHVGPHRSLKYGYAIVDRAIRAGFIRAEYRVTHYALYPGERMNRRGTDN